MDLRVSNRFTNAVIAGASFGALPAGAAVWNEHQAFSTTANTWLMPDLLVPVSIYVATRAPIVVVFIFPVAMLAPRMRPYGLQLVLGALAFWGVALVGASVADRMRRSGLEDFVAQAQPFIEAIEQFERTYGHPPQHLDEITVQPRIRTAACAGPDFELHDQNDPFAYGNAWSVTIYCKRRGTVDHFCYLPHRNYPKYAEKIGSWGYFGG
jgi:hypothetical protein